MVLAKHQMRKCPNALISGATIEFMNRECGSLEYQMSCGMVSIGDISRRDIADDLRAIPKLEIQTDDVLKNHEQFMRGLSDEEARELFPPDAE